jgi:hypothetical protein
MDIKNIEKLRKLIPASISECKCALFEVDNNAEKAFDLLKQLKVKPIVEKTGISIDEAFFVYKQCNGDIEKAIARIQYIRSAPPDGETEYLPDMFKKIRDKSRYASKIFRYLTRDIGTQDYEVFMALLPGLKDDSLLFDYFGEDFIKIMIELLIKINYMVNSNEYKRRMDSMDGFDREAEMQRNNWSRLLLIETIANAINVDKCNTYEKYWIGDYNLNKLLNEYVVLCNDNTHEKAAHCLNDFIANGVKPESVFVKLAENLDDKEHAAAILARMGITDWGEIPYKFYELLVEVKNTYKIFRRSNVISQFILVVHPLCGKNVSKSAISFSYFSYEGALSDWGWNKSGSTERLIEDKIISKREAGIFEKLGNLLFTEQLNSCKIRELYNDFFQGKDPFEVIYSLPE